MIDDAPILNSTKMKAAYSLVRSRLMCTWRKKSNCRTKTHFPGIWTNGIFASKQALNYIVVAQVYKWLRIRHVQFHQEAHQNESTKVSISTRITIPFLNSSWRKKSLTLVLAMDAHDAAAAVASFMTVKAISNLSWYRQQHPPVPVSVALSDCPSIPQTSPRPEQTTKHPFKKPGGHT